VEVINTEDSTTLDFDLSVAFDLYVRQQLVDFWRDNFSGEEAHETEDSFAEKKHGIILPDEEQYHQESGRRHHKHHGRH